MDAIEALVQAELRRPVEPAAATLAEAARAAVGGAVVVLYYGSCLRDGLSTEAVADLYILVADYRRSSRTRLGGLANRALPPNVVYLEAATASGRIRAKAAIVALDQFEAACGKDHFHSYFWARFAQPAALIWTADDATRRRTGRAIADAIPTFASETSARPLAAHDGASAAFWIGGFQKTYASELRAEGPGRAETLYRADQARYDAIYALLAAENLRPAGSPGRWRLRQALGKVLSVLRLAKAIFTFEGGLDYILWKIERHTGVRLEARPWQRRWPLLAAPGLAFKAWRKGGFR